MNIAELYERAVRHGGDRIAIIHAGRSMTYAELGSQANRLVNALRSRGVRRGDRVAFLMANCAEYVVCEYALAKLGAVRVPLAVLLGGEDHIYMLNAARCKILIYHEKLLDRVVDMQPRLLSVEHYICAGGGSASLPNSHERLEQLMRGQLSATQPCELHPEDIAGIYFTGGTTGRPKGVMLSHRSWYHTCWMEMLEFGLGWRETFVFATPMTHAGGCLLLPVLLRQGRCVVLDHFDPDLLIASIRAERATATLLVPTMIYMLLDRTRADAAAVPTLRNVLYGAAPIAPERLKQAIQRFGPIFTQFFGQTEAPMALIALQREDHIIEDPAREIEVLTCAGRPTYPTQIRLLDDDGQDAPPGEAGEIVVRSPNVMSGYLDDPGATASALRDGWLHTGDVARMDGEGLITIVDRKKDMIVTGGFNVYPRDVESTLFEHPAVRQAAVIGAPDEKWGEHVKAIVVLHEGRRADAAELIEFVRQRKGGLLAPKSVEFVDAIPLTNLGKVDKKTLRARYWAGRQRSI
ncbi:MAG TPA: AMP-binding protein [Steroidobacter sp.]|nr:AMP-binding protein [Steroidobacter sp.]